MTLELPIVVSLMVFSVSLASLTISLFGYLRDRSRLRAWSTIVWQSNGPEPQVPIMRICAANIGRRPVMVLNLVKRSGRSKWWRVIQEPRLDNEVISTVEQLERLKQKSLAHNVAVKLSEGEILEFTFLPDDCDEFIAAHEESPIAAKKLQIEDVSGRLYPVKGSRKNLVTLIKAWNP